jgi:hypothetical protein
MQAAQEFDYSQELANTALLLEVGARMERLNFDGAACRNGMATLATVLASGSQSPVDRAVMIYSIIKLRDIAAQYGQPVSDKELSFILTP